MSETIEAFIKRLRDTQKHYLDAMSPFHPDFDPDTIEYYRGKCHGIKLATDLIEDYLSEIGKVG